MKILKFTSPMYPEDNKIIGIFDDDIDDNDPIIQKIIEDEILSAHLRWPNNPSMYEKQKTNYYIIDDIPYYGKKEE